MCSGLFEVHIVLKKQEMLRRLHDGGDVLSPFLTTELAGSILFAALVAAYQCPIRAGKVCFEKSFEVCSLKTDLVEFSSSGHMTLSYSLCRVNLAAYHRIAGVRPGDESRCAFIQRLRAEARRVPAPRADPMLRRSAWYGT